MGRFYFHIRSGTQVIVDQEGADFPDADAARQEAFAAARQIVAEAIRYGNEYAPKEFVIADSEGRELEIVRFAAVLPTGLKH
jgi:hypothetical protein